MKSLGRHVARHMAAGIVALLPIGGFVLTVVWLETTIAGSWLARQPYYFPGCGLLAAAALIYVLGLTVSTVIGRWAWSRFDTLLDRLPALGWLYRSLKEILGYAHGGEAIFRQVVLLASRESCGEELGLVTGSVRDASGAEMLVVFVPGAPNPTTGRLLLVDPEKAQPVPISPSEAMQALVSLGKVSLDSGQ